MATKISKATGNFNTLGTWSPVSTGASCSQPTHSTSATIAGNASATSPNFTGTNTDVVDGVLLWLMRGGITGTVTVEILKGGVSQKSLVVNNSDLPASKSAVFFKFASTLTLDGSATYAVKVSVSNGGSTLTYWRDATSLNFARQLRLTAATTAPANGDVLVVAGELTGAGTSNSFVVTMDNTSSALNLGTNVQTVTTVPHTTQSGIDVGLNGTLQFGTSASTAYYLKLAGHFGVWSGGVLSIGTTGTQMPSTSSAVLEFNNDALTKFGLEINDGGTCNLQGFFKTHMVFLNADAAASATSLTLASVPTGWLNGDDLGIASTTRTSSQSEQKALTADVSTTTASIAALTNAHAGGGGTNGALVKAEIINITRNVKVRGLTGFYSYVYSSATAVCDFDNAEFQFVGSSNTSKRGISPLTTTGSFVMTGCVVKDTNSQTQSLAMDLVFHTTAGNITMDKCVAYNIGNAMISTAAITSATPNVIFTDNVGIKNASAGMFSILDLGVTFTGNIGVSATSTGLVVNEANHITGVFNNNIIHSCNALGAQIANIQPPITGNTINPFGSLLVYRCNGSGAQLDLIRGAIIDGLSLFGHGTQDLILGTACFNMLITNMKMDAGLTLTSSNSFQTNAPCANIIFENAEIGKNQAYASGLNPVLNGNGWYNEMLFINSYLAGVPTPATFQNFGRGSIIAFQKWNQTTGSHRTYKREGSLMTDSAIFRTASPSLRMTPSYSTNKLDTLGWRGGFLKKIANGTALTASVWVRKSVVGDPSGANYNGNQPRLMVKRNAAIGITSDTVLATATTSGWELISGTTAVATDDGVAEFYVDCDGTAGWINVDDVVIT